MNKKKRGSKKDEGQIVGFISMLKNEIGGLFVKPDCHLRGIGTPFYEKNGFELIKVYIQEETNQKVLRMRKEKLI